MQELGYPLGQTRWRIHRSGSRVPLGSILVHGRDGPRPVTTMITHI